MKLYLDKVGIINDSTIELNGLTVITGLNNSGKTTVGKVLFSICDALENMKESSFRDKRRYVYNVFYRLANTIFSLNVDLRNSVYHGIEMEQLQPSMIANINMGHMPEINNEQELVEAIQMFNDDLNNVVVMANKQKSVDDYDRLVPKIREELTFLEKSLSEISLQQYAEAKTETILKLEFNDQILPVVSPESLGKIVLEDEDKKVIDIIIQNNEVTFRDQYLGYTNTNVLFIDNVFVLDDLTNSIDRNRFTSLRNRYNDFLTTVTGEGHNKKIVKLLRRPNDNIYENILIENNTSSIFNKINSVFDDEIKNSEGKFVCAQTKLDIRNLAMGAKVFAIVKQLLENGSINSDTMLILDEPEVHLHPEWQNVLAEVVVLIMKELGTKIVLTTHSSQFLMALETYTKKYKQIEKFKVYSTERDGKEAHYEDATNKLQKVYYKLAQPMFKIKGEMDTL